MARTFAEWNRILKYREYFLKFWFLKRNSTDNFFKIAKFMFLTSSCETILWCLSALLTQRGCHRKTGTVWGWLSSQPAQKAHWPIPRSPWGYSGRICRSAPASGRLPLPSASDREFKRPTALLAGQQGPARPCGSKSQCLQQCFLWVNWPAQV